MTQATALTLLKTGASVFLTGEAGSGKTYAINQYTEYLRKHRIAFAVTASTGIAATHIGGVTIHSWSGIGIASELTEEELGNITKNQYVTKRIKAAKVLIIDEISMLDGRVLTLVDRICRKVKKNVQPFGGIQVILVGDFFQLPPVATDGRATQFAFHSEAWQRLDPTVCYLGEQYRQDDEAFLQVLGAIRRNAFDEDHFESIQERMVERGNIPEDITRLFPRNVDVDSINTTELGKLVSKSKKYLMAARGHAALTTALKKGCLSPEVLFLKEGARVMFTKNNTGAGFVNGTLGTVVGFDQVKQFPIVKTHSGQKITVEPMDWTISEGEEVQAKISQLPLRLAWAMTIHKSQGVSLDAAVVDLSQAFEYGQGYVALSRVRTLSGLHLLGVNPRAFEVHPEVLLQDRFFREASLGAEARYEGMAEAELAALHRNFLIVSGGSVPVKLGGKAKTEESRSVASGQAYRRWKKEDDEKLRKLYNQGTSVKALAKTLSRGEGGIASRLKKLGLVKENI